MSAEEKQNLVPDQGEGGNYGTRNEEEDAINPFEEEEKRNYFKEYFKTYWDKVHVTADLNEEIRCVNLKMWEWILLVFLTVYPLLVGILEGALIPSTSYRDKQLLQPSWAPHPNVFPAIWCFLYLMMGLASFFVYKQGGGFCRDNIVPLVFYFLQLGTNFAWSPVFFGKGELAAGLLVISLLCGLLIATVISFSTRSVGAAVLMLPYLVWVCFALALNYSIVLLNGPTFVYNANVINKTGDN